MLSATTLQERAKEATNAGRHRTARRLLVRALGLTDDDAELAGIEGTLAYVLNELGERERALELCDTALHRVADDLHRVGVLRVQRAVILLRNGDPRAAMGDFSAAIGHLQEQPQYLGRALMNRGTLHLETGHVDDAIADLTRASEQFHSVGLEVQAAKAVHNLGEAHMLAGDLVQALTLLDEADGVLGPMSDLFDAIGRQARAEALFLAGRREQGTELLEGVIASFQAARMRRHVADAELALARHLAGFSLDRARRLAESAARRYARMGVEAQEARSRALAMGCRATLTASALDQAMALADELDRLDFQRERVWVEQRVLHELIRRGQLPSARERLNRLRQAPTAPTRLLVAGVRARLALAEGHPGRARRVAASALTGFQTWQATFGSLDLKASTSAIAADLCAAALASAIADGRPEVVFEWAERARGLASRIVPVRPPSDPRTRADLAELRQLSMLDPLPGTPEAARQARLRAAVQERSWHGGGAGHVREIPSLDAVSAELGRCGSAFVAHLTVGDAVWALVVTDTAAELVPLGPLDDLMDELGGLPAELDVASADVPDDLAEVVRSGLRARLALLDELLLAPLAVHIGGRPVVLVPSAPLRGLPWPMLPSLLGRPVTVPASAAAWLEGRRRTPVPGRVAFVAGPGLARADDEVEASARCWGSSLVLSGVRATGSAARKLAERASVFHVAAHGRHAPDNPLFSQVQLADGLWCAYDLDDLSHAPTTVILSACDVGRGSFDVSEESLGLALAWLDAGARAVIAAVGPVSDAGAAALMPLLHTGLAAGRPPAVALADALAEVGPLTAPFVCLGAGW